MQEPLEQKPLSLKEMILGVILYPSEALLEIARQRPWARAITFIIILGVLTHVVQALAAAKAQFPLPTFVEIITHLVETLLSLAVFTGLVHVIGRQWYYAGDYGGTFCALAFTGVPSILVVFLSIPIILFGIGLPRICTPFLMNLMNCSPTLDPTAGIFMLFLLLAMIIWTIILGVIAIRQLYDLTTGGAIITYIIAAIAHGVLLWLLDQLKEVFK